VRSVRDHVKEMFRGVPKSEELTSIMNEIILNLEDKVEELVFEGKEKEDAINKAIIEFGSVEDIKNELTQKKKVKKEKHRGLGLGFALGGSALIIAFLGLTNFYLFPQFLWFLFPTFGVLWWPLAMFFSWLRSKRRKK